MEAEASTEGEFKTCTKCGIPKPLLAFELRSDTGAPPQ
jgi:hypothetical protein